MSKVIVPCRISYANIWEPRAQEEGEEKKYSLSALIPKTEKDLLNKIKSAINEAISDGVKNKWKGKKPPELWIPLRDGDKPKQNGEETGAEYKAHFYINAKNKNQPQIVDQAVRKILDQSKVASGDYCNVSISFFPYINKGNAGIGASLGNVQLIKNGEPLGSFTRAEDDFEAIEGAEAYGFDADGDDSDPFDF